MGRPKKPVDPNAPVKEKGKRGRPRTKPVSEPVVEKETKAPETVSSITPIDEAKTSTSTEQPRYEAPLGILPIEEDFPPTTSTTTTPTVEKPVDKTEVKAEAKKEEKKQPEKPKEDVYSDHVFEVKSGSLRLLSGDVEIPEGWKIQRITKTSFRFTATGEDGKAIVEEHQFGASSDLLETQLKQYEHGLGKPNPNATPINPLESEIKSPLPPPPPVPVNSIEGMNDYAGTIYRGIMSTPVVKMGRKIQASLIESMLKREDKRYAYELKNEGSGYFITMTSAGNTVRIPANETEFLPVQ